MNFFFWVWLIISYHPNVLDYQQVCMKKIKGPFTKWVCLYYNLNVCENMNILGFCIEHQCISFLPKNLNPIQFKVLPIPFNIFIWMELKFHKINYFFFINWLSLEVCNNMEPKSFIAHKCPKSVIKSKISIMWKVFLDVIPNHIFKLN
jgi:hypothetical protein